MNDFRQPSKTLVAIILWPFQWAYFALNVDVFFMKDTEALRKAIIRLLNAIRYHRDQKGDDRCWFDDLWLYWHLPEVIRYPIKLTREQMKLRCWDFHQLRGDSAICPSKVYGLQKGRVSNDYLDSMGVDKLKGELIRIRTAIRGHQSIDDKTKDDDDRLYGILGDGIQADFRLPLSDVFLTNCALICSKVDPNNVDLSKWPDGMVSPLADWRPE